MLRPANNTSMKEFYCLIRQKLDFHNSASRECNCSTKAESSLTFFVLSKTQGAYKIQKYNSIIYITSKNVRPSKNVQQASSLLTAVHELGLTLHQSTFDPSPSKCSKITEMRHLPNISDGFLRLSTFSS